MAVARKYYSLLRGTTQASCFRIDLWEASPTLKKVSLRLRFSKMFIQIQSNIQYFIVLESLRAQYIYNYIYKYVPWKSRTSKKYVHMKIRRKWVKKYVHVKSL